MNKTNLLFTTLLSVTNFVSAYAETTDVFCAKPDGSDWYWLEDSSNSQVTISGEWETRDLTNVTSSTTFSVSQIDYQTVNASCLAGYVAQPANDRFDKWYIFKVNLANGQYYYAQGKYSVFWIVANLSDRRLKENIQPLEDSLEKISRVNGYSYQWRSTGDSEYGVIAQEIQAEFPELVEEDNQGYLRVDYRGLIPVLLESVKTLNARVEALEANVY